VPFLSPAVIFPLSSTTTATTTTTTTTTTTINTTIADTNTAVPFTSPAVILYNRSLTVWKYLRN